MLVFVDSGGGFNIDTECVNGTRGNAADHLTKDVVPYMISNHGVSADRANWGVVGWSMGGTCAVDLTVMHPDMFSAFEDIAGDLGPNSGTKAQTIARLFGGNADAWAAFDPTTVITRHGPTPGWRAGSPSAVMPPAMAMIRPPPRIRCARWAPPTALTARWSLGRASMIGRLRRTHSRPRCPGWPASSAPPASLPSRCPDRNKILQFFRRLCYQGSALSGCRVAVRVRASASLGVLDVDAGRRRDTLTYLPGYFGHVVC